MARNNETPIRVGLLGAGTVGSQTARLIVEQKDELSARIGRPIELTGVACLDPKETEKFPWIDQSIVTTDTLSVATNSDIVIELIGGTTVARKFVLAAIESGASVVTANKALLAKYGPEIYSAAEAKGVDIYFEAAVGGAIPFLRPLRESLVGDKVTSMLGIVNGTTNYILDEMTTKGLQFDDVLKDAQAKGYAEADPTGDIEGYDAANKAAIMATLGFHTSVTIDDVSVEGITKITADDIAAATAEHKVIKLLAVVENGEAGVSARVYPALIDENHPLAYADITYGCYGVWCGLMHIPSHIIPLKEDFTLDPADYYGLNETIVIANPNAPTGIAVPRNDIQRLLEANPDRVVIVDEAYVDFGAESCVPMIYRYDNLLVTQTMSKSRSLAGGRVGYALGSPELIADLNRVKYSFHPYNVNRLSIAAGAAAVADEAYFAACTAAIRQTRAWTVGELENLGFTVLPSQANFVFARHSQLPGETLYRKLKENGVLVRWFDADRIRDYIRITIGSMEQMETLVEELTAILEEL